MSNDSISTERDLYFGPGTRWLHRVQSEIILERRKLEGILRNFYKVRINTRYTYSYSGTLNHFKWLIAIQYTSF